ncbi:MAG: hypothetical protein R6V03_04230 [Kiritimatiellia bacterium]
MLICSLDKTNTMRMKDAKKKYQGDNVVAGREWVDAYVKYVIYVKNLYTTIQAGPPHGVGGE